MSAYCAVPGCPLNVIRLFGHRAMRQQLPPWWLDAVCWYGFILLIIVFLIFSWGRTDDRSEQCRVRGGVLVESMSGYVCLDRDALVKETK